MGFFQDGLKSGSLVRSYSPSVGPSLVSWPKATSGALASPAISVLLVMGSGMRDLLLQFRPNRRNKKVPPR